MDLMCKLCNLTFPIKMSFEPLEFTQLNSWAYKTFSYFSSDLKNPIALIWNLSISILHHNRTDTTIKYAWSDSAK